jgi:hypothetical protein
VTHVTPPPTSHRGNFGIEPNNSIPYYPLQTAQLLDGDSARGYEAMLLNSGDRHLALGTIHSAD